MIDERVWALIQSQIYVGPQGLNYALKNAMILYNVQYERMRCKKCARLVLDCDDKHELKLIKTETICKE